MKVWVSAFSMPQMLALRLSEYNIISDIAWCDLDNVYVGHDGYVCFRDVVVQPAIPRDKSSVRLPRSAPDVTVHGVLVDVGNMTYKLIHVQLRVTSELIEVHFRWNSIAQRAHSSKARYKKKT